jgi:hydroxyacylglutathione hydrolase
VPQSTLGYELRTNWAFQIPDEQEFVRLALADQPEPPAYFARMKKLNTHGVAQTLAAPVFDDRTLRARVRDGALVLDTRPSAEFLTRHLQGSISIPIGRSFLTWAGSVLDAERELVLLVAPDEMYQADALRRDLALIGYDRVLGALPTNEIASFSPRPLDSIASVPASRLSEHAFAGSVIDVRSQAEWNEGHVPGAMHVPLAELGRRLAELRSREPLMIYCQGGARSATAASLLRAAGVRGVTNVDGGFEAWTRDNGATAVVESRR